MIGMAVAGLLYGRFGLFPILAVSAVCFAVTAVMDLFIRIPYKQQSASGSVVQIIKSDISQSARFTFKEKPILAKCAFIVFLLNAFGSSLLIVGSPVLITQHLGMGMEAVGISQSIMMLGGLIGGIAAGALGARLTMSNAFLFLAVGSISIMPMGLVFLFDTPPFMAYITITAVSAFLLCTSQLFGIATITFIQGLTPTELIGKVLSLIMVLPFLASAAGQLLYGALFEMFAARPWIVIFATALLCALIAVYSRGYFITPTNIDD
jgi:MFS family permease